MRPLYIPLIRKLDLLRWEILPTVYAIWAPMRFGGFRVIELWGDWNWEG